MAEGLFATEVMELSVLKFSLTTETRQMPGAIRPWSADWITPASNGSVVLSCVAVHVVGFL
eukprot:scaffold133509_cov51-Attheya_sp.AAC.2